jgi:hypothetical protein
MGGQVSQSRMVGRVFRGKEMEIPALIRDLTDPANRMDAIWHRDEKDAHRSDPGP